MKVPIRPTGATGGLAFMSRVGPVCIACGNTQKFWVLEDGKNELAELSDLAEGVAQVTACGRCNSRNSVMLSNVD
jgi:hypothetical protein